ncbi:hypothetical protein [Lacticaseibacillus nasuensis]|nr:hypothetical protein [Lacticaseibacillus nasuensis]MCX2455663.1 hypothetical protein [Lacticaseibacillus nasuensis]
MITALILWIHAHESWVMLTLIVAGLSYACGRGSKGQWRKWVDIF